MQSNYHQTSHCWLSQTYHTFVSKNIQACSLTAARSLASKSNASFSRPHWNRTTSSRPLPSGRITPGLSFAVGEGGISGNELCFLLFMVLICAMIYINCYDLMRTWNDQANMVSQNARWLIDFSSLSKWTPSTMAASLHFKHYPNTSLVFSATPDKYQPDCTQVVHSNMKARGSTGKENSDTLPISHR